MITVTVPRTKPEENKEEEPVIPKADFSFLPPSLQALLDDLDIKTKPEEPVKKQEEKKPEPVSRPVVKKPVNPSHDPVDHPAHYTGGGIETIDFIEAKCLDFCLGNVVKYVVRAGHKGDKLEDLKKARWYLDREIGNLQRAND